MRIDERKFFSLQFLFTFVKLNFANFVKNQVVSDLKANSKITVQQTKDVKILLCNKLSSKLTGKSLLFVGKREKKCSFHNLKTTHTHSCNVLSWISKLQLSVVSVAKFP